MNKPKTPLTKTVQHMCFTVTGEFVTCHARDRVIEGEWEDAVRFLKTSLVEIDYNTIIQILSGTHSLIGDSNKGLELSDKPDVKYMQKLDEMYGFYVRIGRQWFVPYSFITSYGYYDFSHYSTDDKEQFSSHYDVSDKEQISNNPEREIQGTRARFYCKSPKDKIFYLKCPDNEMHCVLFEKTAAPPIWMEIDKSPQHAVNACWRLQEDGHLIRYTDEDLPLCWRKGYDRSTGIVTERKQDREKPVLIKAPEVDKKLLSQFGWVSPEGKLYGCQYAGHIELAERIVQVTLGNKEFEDDSGFLHNKSESILENLGWIKIGGLGKTKYFLGKSEKSTRLQHHTIEEWCKQNNQRFPDYCFDKEADML